jgi:farnesyl diphosphate synthase
LPIACGLHLAGITEEKAFTSAKDILIKMGTYFQIQDDYLDCFADAAVLGKIGTDIQDNKCSWLICRALEVATDAQKAVITENYGKDEPARIQAVKDLYRCACHLVQQG